MKMTIIPKKKSSNQNSGIIWSTTHHDL